MTDSLWTLDAIKKLLEDMNPKANSSEFDISFCCAARNTFDAESPAIILQLVARVEELEQRLGDIVEQDCEREMDIDPYAGDCIGYK